MNRKQISASVAEDVSLGGKFLSIASASGRCALRAMASGAAKGSEGALAVLRRAVELDVNFIDTADSYGPHVNEELIAEPVSLRARPGDCPREAGTVPARISGPTMQRPICETRIRDLGNRSMFVLDSSFPLMLG